MRRCTCLRIPWPEDVSEAEERNGIPEVQKWLRQLLACDTVAVAASGVASLLYSLGGRTASHGHRARQVPVAVARADMGALGAEMAMCLTLRIC